MPSHPTAAARGCNPELRPDAAQDWQLLLQYLPTALETLANKTGAIQRRRVVKSGEMLLRLVLVYVLCCFSLADTAAWAARSLGVALTRDALAYRFAHATSLLQQIVRQLIQTRVREQAATGVTLRVLDASVLTEPGSTGTDWRLHLTYAPTRSEIVGAELTDAHGGEHVSRAPGAAGDLVIGDCCYGHASDVRDCTARQLRCLFRAHLQSLAVTDLQGQRLEPTSLLDAADAGRYDQQVLLPERGHEPVPARLVVVPLPAEQAGRARQRLRKAAAKKGKQPSELTLRLAGYFCCITTLTLEQASVEALLRWYRFRWQIELLFKRCKSLLHLDQVNKARPDLVAVQVWARLLVAILVEFMASGTRAAVPFDPTAPPVSTWQLTHIHYLDVVLAVYGGRPLEDRLAAAEATASRLRERPRRKRTWASQLLDQFVLRPGPSPPSLV